MSGTTQHQGQAAEQLACSYLQEQGLQLIARNYHSRFGELDLVMRDNRQLVFIEVRYRRHSHFGSGAETIQAAKQAKLIKTAQAFLQSQPKLGKLAARFDVVSISGPMHNPTIDWIPNAFQS